MLPINSTFFWHTCISIYKYIYIHTYKSHLPPIPPIQPPSNHLTLVSCSVKFNKGDACTASTSCASSVTPKASPFGNEFPRKKGSSSRGKRKTPSWTNKKPNKWMGFPKGFVDNLLFNFWMLIFFSSWTILSILGRGKKDLGIFSSTTFLLGRLH